ncbi:MAG: hypothetical protein AAFY82_01550 [Pseudomonadota bacterium]
MIPRAAALALAAPLLFAAPALADSGKSSKRVSGGITVSTGNGALQLSVSNRGYGSVGYSTNQRYYGHTDRYHRADRGARRTAVQACRRAIRHEADYLGFRDVDFDDGRHVEQIGPRGFRVTFNEVEFETRRREYERPVTCIVRQGDVVKRVDGIPAPRRHGHNQRRGYYR